jgi:type IV pilus assembly protein PilA
MNKLINRPLPKRRDDEGFTLIELLVVVVIIGILVAIAVPVYLNYRQGAADKSAQSDVRGAITAVEQFYTDNANGYPATSGVKTTTFTLTGSTLTVTLSEKTQLSYIKAADGLSYQICAKNDGGNKYFYYSSQSGGSVTSKTITSLTSCT